MSQQEGIPAVLAVDVGGSKYMTGLVCPSGKVLWKERAVWSQINAQAVYNQLEQAISHALCVAQNRNISVSAIGMTIPGLADPERGRWISARFMGIYDLAIGPLLAQKFSLPVFLDNDCQACALAEWQFGSCTDCKHFLYLTVSNGVGGALFLNGALYYGAGGFAGEMGQLPLTDLEGKFSTLEDLASGRALWERYLALGGKVPQNLTIPTGAFLTQQAEVGDPAALKAFQAEGYYLGLGILAASKLLDPGRVIIGGGLSLAFDYYQKPLLHTLHAHYTGRAQPPQVFCTSLGYDGGLLGAAALALRGSIHL